VDLRGLTGTDSSIQHADRALSQSEARRTKSCKNVSAACASLSSAPLESLEETTRQARAFCAHLRSASSSPQWRSCKLPHFTGDCRARCLSSLSLSTALSRIAHFTEKVSFRRPTESPDIQGNDDHCLWLGSLTSGRSHHQRCKHASTSPSHAPSHALVLVPLEQNETRRCVASHHGWISRHWPWPGPAQDTTHSSIDSIASFHLTLTQESKHVSLHQAHLLTTDTS
jgi:hypothetical protein